MNCMLEVNHPIEHFTGVLAKCAKSVYIVTLVLSMCTFYFEWQVIPQKRVKYMCLLQILSIAPGSFDCLHYVLFVVAPTAFGISQYTAT